MLDPVMIDEAVQPLIEDHSISMSTLKVKIKPEDYNDPAVVKVVTDENDFALYFSRSLIPFSRDNRTVDVFEHIGIYGYQKDFLHKLTQLEPTPLEKTEALEQLRVIENGFSIKVIHTTAQDYIPLSIDTREDLERARALIGGG